MENTLLLKSALDGYKDKPKVVQAGTAIVIKDVHIVKPQGNDKKTMVVKKTPIRSTVANSQHTSSDPVS